MASSPPSLMDPLAATLMTAEAVGSPLHIGGVLMLRKPRGAGRTYVERLRARAVAPGLPVDPRLRRRPVRSLRTGGLWAWEEVDLDLTEHVQVHRITGGLDELWRAVGDLHSERLDRTRPLWRAWLFDGLPEDRFALYVTVHHAVLDGLSGLRLVTDAMSTDPRQRGLPPFYADVSRAEPAEDREEPERKGRWETALETVAGAAGGGARLVEAEVDLARRTLRGDTLDLPFTAPRTRLNQGLGERRSFVATQWSRARIQAVQRAAGVTGNDVVTAVIGGALRAWFAAYDVPPTRSLVAICPISAHPVGDAGEGNDFGIAFCRLGTDLADPAERLRLVHGDMAAAKDRVGRLGSVSSLLLAAPSILPSVLLPMLPFDPHVPPGFNVPISHVPGPRDTLYWNGARLEGIYPVSTVYDGLALNPTLCSYRDQVCVGIVADADAVPQVQELVPLADQALAELEEAVLT